MSTLSTEVFLQSFRRFVARRGRPSIVYSDCGKNFVGASNLLEKVDWEEVVKKTAVERIVWKFNPPSAAWWGGWWERLIRLLKELLRKVLGRANLNYEELSTVVCDCEVVINGRPISYISDSEQILSPLTPAMFLKDIKESGIPDFEFLDQESLNRRIRYRNKLSLDLKKRFRIEYLGALRQHYT